MLAADLKMADCGDPAALPLGLLIRFFEGESMSKAKLCSLTPLMRLCGYIELCLYLKALFRLKPVVL